MSRGQPEPEEWPPTPTSGGSSSPLSPRLSPTWSSASGQTTPRDLYAGADPDEHHYTEQTGTGGLLRPQLRVVSRDKAAVAMDWTGKQQFMVAEKALKKMSVEDLRQSAKMMHDQLQKAEDCAAVLAEHANIDLDDSTGDISWKQVEKHHGKKGIATLHTTAGVNKMLMSDHNTLAKTDNTLSWLCRNEVIFAKPFKDERLDFDWALVFPLEVDVEGLEPGDRRIPHELWFLANSFWKCNFVLRHDVTSDGHNVILQIAAPLSVLMEEAQDCKVLLRMQSTKGSLAYHSDIIASYASRHGGLNEWHNGHWNHRSIDAQEARFVSSEHPDNPDVAQAKREAESKELKREQAERIAKEKKNDMTKKKKKKKKRSSSKDEDETAELAIFDGKLTSNERALLDGDRSGSTSARSQASSTSTWDSDEDEDDDAGLAPTTSKEEKVNHAATVDTDPLAAKAATAVRRNALSKRDKMRVFTSSTRARLIMHRMKRIEHLDLVTRMSWKQPDQELKKVKKRVAKGLDITGSRLRGLLVAVGANRAGSEKEDCFGKNVARIAEQTYKNKTFIVRDLSNEQLATMEEELEMEKSESQRQLVVTEEEASSDSEDESMDPAAKFVVVDEPEASTALSLISGALFGDGEEAGLLDGGCCKRNAKGDDMEQVIENMKEHGIRYDDIREALKRIEHWINPLNGPGRMEDFVGTLKCYFPLHNAAELEYLKAEWGNYSMVLRTTAVGYNVETAGEPSFSSSYTSVHEHSLPWAWTYQPLYEIREYFGDDVGLYFSWLGMYTQGLFLLALFGSLTMALQPFFGGSPDKNPFTIAYSVYLGMWSVSFLETWKRRERELVFLWGSGFGENAGSNVLHDSPMRPQFVGISVMNPDTRHESMQHYSNAQYVLKRVVSWVICVTMMGATVLGALTALNLRVFLKDLKFVPGSDFLLENPDAAQTLWEKFKPDIISAGSNLLVIQGAGVTYELLATKLTNWENHRTEYDYDAAKTSKYFVFQFINNYFVLFYIAYLKAYEDPIFHIRSPCPGRTCMDDLQFQMSIVFTGKIYAKQVGYNLRPFAFGFAMERWAVHKIKATYASLTESTAQSLEQVLPKGTRNVLHAVEVAEAQNKKRAESGVGLVSEVPKITRHLLRRYWNQAELEMNMMPFTGTFDDFNDRTIQFGYLVLWGSAFPLAPLVAFFNNVIEIRGAGKKMCFAHQRTEWSQRNSVGAWLTVLSLIAFAGVVTNATMLTFVGSQLSDDLGINETEAYIVSDRVGQVSLCWVFFLIEHSVMLMRVMLSQFFPELPPWILRSIDTLAYRKEKVYITETVLMMRAAQVQKHALSRQGLIVTMRTQKGKYDKLNINAFRTEFARLEEEERIKLRAEATAATTTDRRRATINQSESKGSLSIEYLEEMLTFSEMRERMSTAELEVAKVRLQHRSSTIERPAFVFQDFWEFWRETFYRTATSKNCVLWMGGIAREDAIRLKVRSMCEHHFGKVRGVSIQQKGEKNEGPMKCWCLVRFYDHKAAQRAIKRGSVACRISATRAWDMHKKHNTGGGWYRWQVRNAELETHLTRDGTNKLKSAIEALDQDDRPTHLAAAMTIQGCMRGRLFRIVASSMRTENDGILREYADTSAPEPASRKKKKKAKPTSQKNKVDNPLAYSNPTWSESEVERE